ncbi:MAG: VWA domain-containing protein [bacterium]|nr:VWA domain-containing protein [bacterium]
MGLEYPQLLLLLLLVVPLYKYITVKNQRFLNGLRLSLILLIILSLAGPYLNLTGKGMDLIVIRDRSASITAEAAKESDELVRLLGTSSSRSGDDRVSVIGFAAGATVEIQPTVEPVSVLNQWSYNKNGSSLSEALMLASVLRSPLRRSRILVLSDGMYTGSKPTTSEIPAALQGIPVWHRYIGKPKSGDIASEGITLPAEITTDTGFIVRFSITSENDSPARYALKRGNTVISQGEVQLKRGVNTFFTRDIIVGEAGQKSSGNDSKESAKNSVKPRLPVGIQEYRLEVEAEHDRLMENNRCSALLKVTTPPRVLLASGAGKPGVLYRILNRANIPVDSVEPGEMDWSPAKLTPYKVVILENVPMKQLGFGNARALSEAVKSGIVSLIVTGGEHSFGGGGYHKSPLDPLLPISMELKQEQRKGIMALVAVLDRSGSMSMPVSGGATKMDLANIGVSEAIKLLSPLDQVAVIAVDSQAHVIVPLSMADDTGQLVSAVLSIQSMGGGIFVRTAMEAAAKEIRKSNLPNRHIILFSDSQDSEEQKDTVAFTKKLRKEGIGVSVIGLGTPADSDSLFLKEVAAAGEGDIYFTTDAAELPQVFSQEVIRVSRRGFAREATPTTLLPDILRLQIPIDKAPPVLGGYNLSSLRKGASCAVITADDFKAPVIAFWQKGNVFAAAVTAEVDGPYTGEFAKWPESQELIVNLVRLAAGHIKSSHCKAYSYFRRGEATVRIEFDEETADRVRSKLTNVEFLPPGGAEVVRVPLKWEDAVTAYVDVELPGKGHYLPVIDLGEEGVLKAPAVSSDYSSEFLFEGDIDGEEVLDTLSGLTGGRAMVNVDELFSVEGLEAMGSKRDIRLWVILLIFFLLLLEIAERRLVFSEVVLSMAKRFFATEVTESTEEKDKR